MFALSVHVVGVGGLPVVSCTSIPSFDTSSDADHRKAVQQVASAHNNSPTNTQQKELEPPPQPVSTTTTKKSGCLPACGSHPPLESS